MDLTYFSDEINLLPQWETPTRYKVTSVDCRSFKMNVLGRNSF